LKQDVSLTRAPNAHVDGATTWESTSYIGTVGAEKLSSIRGNVKDQVDQFINAYLAANPKK
jgi:hypothetical protein